ncbi:MAG: bifunctional phosphopantothenoylcysteine decarboxylase/phosphopantothenate--cysteine ligase CoaBC [Acetatifactor sp.]|nr:bifunctional phosphopantothenoylcysteine decarboxylase/phosphopantothenate--cysteine ligase CoaBC [Acetatifactor sp.]
MIDNKTVVLGVTGSIAAYKTASLASALKKLNCDVHVIMTKNAVNFINPITFETLTGNKCLIDTFDRNFEFNVEHVALAKAADIFVVAPASANVIGKIAGGIADDMLTTTILGCKCPVLVAPAMNTNMYDNPILQDNLDKLRRFGYRIIEPAEGYLACGDTGKGKMPEPEELLEYIKLEIAEKKDLAGKRIVITAGPTIEKLDPVRFISNHSTGKMGYALAAECARRGADVTLVSGPVAIKAPMGVELVKINSAREMASAVKERFSCTDIVIKAAAVADYRPVSVSSEKIKKSDSDMSIELERTEDILKYLGEHKAPGQIVCGFSMETENLIDNSRAKLNKKNCDMIVANNLKVAGAGFGTDTNVVTLITAEGETELEIMSKEMVAHRIMDEIVKMSVQKSC